MFLVQICVFQILVRTSKYRFLVPSCNSWISVPSTDNEKFMFVPYAFSRVVMLNLISILVLSLPFSTIDSNLQEALLS
jgi:hypothetical protein